MAFNTADWDDMEEDEEDDSSGYGSGEESEEDGSEEGQEEQENQDGENENSDEEQSEENEEENSEEEQEEGEDQEEDEEDKESKEDEEEEANSGPNLTKKEKQHAETMCEANNMAKIPHYKACPTCGKKSLYMQPVMWVGIKLAAYICAACVGAVDASKATNVPGFRCMNKKCPDYWPKQGNQFFKTDTGRLEKRKNIFHINK